MTRNLFCSFLIRSHYSHELVPYANLYYMMLRRVKKTLWHVLVLHEFPIHIVARQRKGVKVRFRNYGAFQTLPFSISAEFAPILLGRSVKI